MVKFSPKIFLNKKRIERSVKGSPGISKIFSWSELKQEYLPPPRGKAYIATRKRVSGFTELDEKRTFDTLNMAQAWRNGAVESQRLQESSGTPYFKDILDEYKLKRFPQLKPSTQESYTKLISSR